MEPIDSFSPHFRLAKERWPNAPTLSNHYNALVESYEGSAHSLIATIKSFVECVCLTVLGEFGRSMPSSDPSTTELLVEALKSLGLQNSRGASKVDKLLSAHNRLADALTELRNESDPVAHGKDGFLDALSNNERRAFLVTADTILALLLAAHAGTEPDLQYTREPYDRFVHLHERIDRAVTIETSVDEEDNQTLVVTVRTGGQNEGVKLRVEPSRLLYAIDRTAYVEVLASTTTEPTPSPVTSEISIGVAADMELRRAPEPAPAVAEVVPSYEGSLSPLRQPLDQYLATLSLSPTVSSRAGSSLLDSLLAAADRHLGLDWQIREPLQAAMKVSLRRTFIQFGVSPEEAERGASHLVSWLKIQAVGLAPISST